MKRFSNVLPLALCVSVLAVTLSVPATRAAGPPSGLAVDVVNTPANPVPVTLQGTGTVSGNVAVTNTPNVNVVNTPTVNLPAGTTVHTLSATPSGAFSVAVDPRPISHIFADPAGTNFAITSLTAQNVQTIGTDTLILSLDGFYGSGCKGGVGEFVQGPSIAVPANATVHLVFPQPFIITALPGAVSCLKADVGFGAGTGASLMVTVVGYKF